MRTFNDLIRDGVAAALRTEIITNDFEGLDRFAINYNNIWGIISDTHMSKGEDGNYYITGQLFRDANKTTNFVYATTWGDYHFHDSSLRAENLITYARNNGKTISHEIVNGDDVLVLRDLTDEQKAYLAANDIQSEPVPVTANVELGQSLNFTY